MSKTSRKASHLSLAEDLRNRILAGEFPPGSRLPTEEQLRQPYGVSRHTVRTALKKLVADGLIDQVQGSGTYVRGHPDNMGEYVRTINSLDDLTVWPRTKIEVVQPFLPEENPIIAARLRLASTSVARAVLRRYFDAEPFVWTNHFVAAPLGARLTSLNIPNVNTQTIIGEAEPHLDHPIAGVQQIISAVSASTELAEQIGMEPGDAAIFIERLYYDNRGVFIEMTESYFDPRRYTYRMDLNRRGKGF